MLDKLVRFYFVALHLPVQGAAIDIEHAGGLGFVSSSPFQSINEFIFFANIRESRHAGVHCCSVLLVFQGCVC